MQISSAIIADADDNCLLHNCNHKLWAASTWTATAVDVIRTLTTPIWDFRIHNILQLHGDTGWVPIPSRNVFNFSVSLHFFFSVSVSVSPAAVPRHDDALDTARRCRSRTAWTALQFPLHLQLQLWLYRYRCPFVCSVIYLGSFTSIIFFFFCCVVRFEIYAKYSLSQPSTQPHSAQIMSKPAFPATFTLFCLPFCICICGCRCVLYPVSVQCQGVGRTEVSFVYDDLMYLLPLLLHFAKWQKLL